MIWLILGCLSAGAIFGYVICGLLTYSRIRELEGFIIRIAEADVKKREQELKFVQELFGPKELDERVRSKSPKPH